MTLLGLGLRTVDSCVRAGVEELPKPSCPHNHPWISTMALYTPEFIAHVRDRYENGEEPLGAICADLEISTRALYRMRQREVWQKRSERPPRELPEPVRLLQEATALASEKEAAACAEEPAPDDEPTPDTQPAVDRIERLVRAHLAAEEARQRQSRTQPQSRSTAERAARTLALLTETLQKLQRLRAGMPISGQVDDDDIPADIDEFRRRLARRIDAFVASRTDASVDGGP